MQVDTEDDQFILSTKNTETNIEQDFPYSEEDLEIKYNDEDNIYFMERQLCNSRNKDYMNLHRYINSYMRSMLFDWMMEVSRQFYFKRNTYHLAIVLVDIYLSIKTDIQTSCLQLIGVTCLSVAAKSEVSQILNSKINNNLYTKYLPLGNNYPRYQDPKYVYGKRIYSARDHFF
jgi:hypothetical protein